MLRELSDQVGYWVEPSELARRINRPTERVRAVLDELSREGVLHAAGPADSLIYRLPDGEPTTVVVGRMVAEATHNRDLRRIIVTHIVGAARA